MPARSDPRISDCSSVSQSYRIQSHSLVYPSHWKHSLIKDGNNWPADLHARHEQTMIIEHAY
jgi:hypothetical protein